MSAVVGPGSTHLTPLRSGLDRHDVGRDYRVRVLLPGLLALLLTPVLGPVSFLLDQMAYDVLDGQASGPVTVVEIVLGGLMYVVTLVNAVQLGRRHREDRRQHVANGARGWHAASVVLLVVLTLVAVLFVLSAVVLTMMLTEMNAGL